MATPTDNTTFIQLTPAKDQVTIYKTAVLIIMYYRLMKGNIILRFPSKLKQFFFFFFRAGQTLAHIFLQHYPN